MTNNAPNEPNGPRMNGTTQQTPRGVYNPITVGGNGKQEEPSWFEAGLESPIVRPLLMGLFAVIFGIAWLRPEFSPLTIIVLVGCLLYRLEPWQRKIATAPLLLAAIRFYLFLPSYSAEVAPHINPFTGKADSTPGGPYGVPWMLAFLSVCLFFLPRKHSTTLKIVVGESLAVILSSFLPVSGFLAILAMFNYTLFFAVGIGLLVDLKPGLQALLTDGSAHAVPLGPRVPASASAPPSRPLV